MTREEAKKAAEVMLAYAEGKEIEAKSDSSLDTWKIKTSPLFNWRNNYYRIKPSPKYRPFKDAEECWQEMQKHQPFGWIKDKKDGHYTTITHIKEEENDMVIGTNEGWVSEGIYKFFTFADGTPFGIKEEE